MHESRPVSNNTKAPSRVNGARSSTTFSTTGWALLPEHEYIDDGISGARLDRPALDRLRDAARRGEFDAVVILSPDRLARNYAHQWLLIEEFEKMHTPLIFLQNPFGDSPQGKLLTQMQGMIAEYERAQITERTRRGRLEKARQRRVHAVGVHVLRLPLSAETSRLRAAGDDRARRKPQSCGTSIARWWKNN